MKQRVFLVIFTGIMFTSLASGLVNPFLAIYAREEFGAPGYIIGLMSAGFGISRTLFSPFIGRWSDRFGKKIFLLMGQIVLFLVAFGYDSAGTAWALVALRFIYGLSNTMEWPISTALIGEITPIGKEGRYMGFLNSTFFIGWGLGPIVGGMIKDRFSMRGNFLIMKVVSLVAFIITCFLPGEQALREYKKRERSAGRLREAENELVSVREMFTDGKTKGIMGYQFINNLGRGASFNFMSLLNREAGLSNREVGILMTMYMTPSGIIQFVTGRLADRVSKVALVHHGNTLKCIAFFFIPFCKSFWTFLFLYIFMGLLEGMFTPAFQGMAIELGRDYGQGSTQGVLQTANSAGMALGSINNGMIQDLLGLPFVFYFGSLLGFVANGFLLRHMRLDGRRRKEVKREVKSPLS
ncbi:MAG: MFS transporter [Candidatus Tectomicrobia bacterium]|nr:MFS transporter [Candidatus Tectomicrobia bacterium]